MNDNLSLLTNRVRTLQERRETLVTSLRRAAADLRTHGRAPAETVRTELEEFHREWESLVADLETHELEPPADLEEAAARVDEVQRQSRTESALEALEGLDRICGDDGELTPAAMEIRSAAESVRAGVTNEEFPDTSAIEALQTGRHPLVMLRRLLEEEEALSDDDWEEAVESIRNQFGRGVATAVVRRRLTIAPESGSADGDG
ncbi:hypothetical protein [Maioricimonas rarisocia]|uniref:hypothetical protein n=1 Tax=Maioricimonas rarisocia TaxID=2528026 RepID=UPI0011A30CDA|nr:hypothetical protein [Maioricimonas rarisocia]